MASTDILEAIGKVDEAGAASGEVSEGDGLMSALQRYGAQDDCMWRSAERDGNQERGVCWDSRELFLRDRHVVAYRPLPASRGGQDPEEVVFTLERASDLVGGVDLVLHDPDRLGVAGILRSVVVEIGGQQIDAWRCWHADGLAAASADGAAFATLVTTVAGLHGRAVTRSGDALFVPLALAPFHDHNLLPLLALKYHPVKFMVRFAASYVSRGSHTRAALHGDQYMLDAVGRLKAVKNPLRIGVAQTQSSEGFRTVEGGGEASQALCLNHPIRTLFFWGFDVATVTRVRLTLDGAPFYDGPVEPLERLKAVRGFGHLEPTALFFAREPADSPFQSTVNFSRVDRAVLHITTAPGTPARHVFVAAISVQPMKFAGGMAGLSFSK
jgi:hypothetical protein